MRDRILRFLKSRGKALPADLILRDALGIHAPNAATAERILAAMLHGDNRFRRSRHRWSLSPMGADMSQGGLPNAGVLFVERATGSSDALAIRGAAFVPATGFLSSFGLAGEPAGFESVPLIQEALGQRTVIVWNRRSHSLWKRVLQAHGVADQGGEFVLLSSLARRALDLSAAAILPEDLAGRLELPTPDVDNPAAMARFLASCWQSLLERVPEDRRRDCESLQQWIDEGRPKVDLSHFGFGAEFLSRLPESPGVYLMKNRAGNIIYVGKSRNLKARVRSYFRAGALRDPKVRRIHQQLHVIEVVPTANEVEALLLEIRMIRDLRPSINLQEEVHESRQLYGRKSNCVVLVPSVEGRTAAIYLFHDGSFVGRTTARLGQAAGKRLSAKIRSVYFGPGRRRGARPEIWEAEVISRWLNAGRSRVNSVDIGEAGSYDDAVRLLNAYLKDPDRLTRKVYYR